MSLSRVLVATANKSMCVVVVVVVAVVMVVLDVVVMANTISYAVVRSCMS